MGYSMDAWNILIMKTMKSLWGGFLKFFGIWLIPLLMPIVDSKVNWLGQGGLFVFGSILLPACYIFSIKYFFSEVTGHKKEIWATSLIVFLLSVFLIFVSSRYILPGSFGASNSLGAPWDNFYIATIIFTTVGLGDFVPLSNYAQYFTCSLALLGVTHAIVTFSIVISGLRDEPYKSKI